jgi:hypothetical protein
MLLGHLLGRQVHAARLALEARPLPRRIRCRDTLIPE